MAYTKPITGRGLNSGKGRKKGSRNKLKVWQQVTLAQNVIYAITPLQLKVLMVVDLEKFIQLIKLPVVIRALEVHGETVKGFIGRNRGGLDDVRELGQALDQIMQTDVGKRYRREGRL